MMDNSTLDNMTMVYKGVTMTARQMIRLKEIEANGTEIEMPKGGDQEVALEKVLEVVESAEWVEEAKIEEVVVTNTEEKSIETIQKEYHEKTGKNVPNRYKNDREWIENALSQ